MKLEHRSSWFDIEYPQKDLEQSLTFTMATQGEWFCEEIGGNCTAVWPKIQPLLVLLVVCLSWPICPKNERQSHRDNLMVRKRNNNRGATPMGKHRRSVPFNADRQVSRSRPRRVVSLLDPSIPFIYITWSCSQKCLSSSLASQFDKYNVGTTLQ